VVYQNVVKVVLFEANFKKGHLPYEHDFSFQKVKNHPQALYSAEAR
jgi:hypothetical protein